MYSVYMNMLCHPQLHSATTHQQTSVISQPFTMFAKVFNPNFSGAMNLPTQLKARKLTHKTIVLCRFDIKIELHFA